jgi:23S rRNA (adenine2503-C2)-methyltransferase
MGTEWAGEPLARPLIVMPPPGSRDPRPGLSGVDPAELGRWLAENGYPGYRARQLADHIWTASSVSVDEMQTLPAALRLRVAEHFRVDTLVETEVRPADAGLTEKALHRLDDGRLIESVLMRYPARGPRRERATICISSQAGCAVGCPFCATGELGFWRDLSTAEIVDQVRFWRRRLAGEGRRVTNVVFMGMGEPLLNTERVLEAAEALTDGRRFGLGARHLTISTSGVVPGIQELTRLRPQYTLAVSLHAARPELRDVLVPLNRRYPVANVVAAAAQYARATGRRVTYEYVLIDGINDTREDAAELSRLLSGHLAHVNLIPMNPVAHTPWQPSPPDRTEAFAAVIRSAGLRTTVRRNRGIEIGAACGQLAADQAGQPSPSAVSRRRDLLVQQSAAALAGRPATGNGRVVPSAPTSGNVAAVAPSNRAPVLGG